MLNIASFVFAIMSVLVFGDSVLAKDSFVFENPIFLFVLFFLAFIKVFGLGHYRAFAFSVFLFLAPAVFFAFNRAYLGGHLMSMGVVLNGLVLIANNGRMPVDPKARRKAGFPGEPEESHVFMTEDTKLPSFCDRFYSRWLSDGVVSIGDIMIFSGPIFLFAQAVLEKKMSQ